MTVLTIDLPTWRTLRLLQDSLAFMASDPRYTLAVKKEKKLYNHIINEIYEQSSY